MTTRTPDAPPSSWVPVYTLTVLFVANVFNYADRTLLGIVVEPIRRELLLNDTQISIVSGFAFVLFNLVAGIGIAQWADRGNRPLILALGVALWSAATALTGIAHSFAALIVCRMLVGVGEATVFPVAVSLLADLYPGSRLPRSVSIFQSSSGVGVVIGSVLAGVLAADLGWRTMFTLCGAAGSALVLLILLTMRPAARGRAPDTRPARHGGMVEAVADVMRVPGFPLLAIGYAASNMMLAVLPTWAPAFLLRSHGVALADVGFVIGPAAVVGGLAGTILSGMLATRLIRARGDPTAGLLVPIVALPLAAPAYAVLLFAPTITMVVAGIAVMNFMLSSSLGPCVALAVSRVPHDRRGLTSTLMLIAQTLLGFGLSPLLVGILSDALTPGYGAEALRHALAIMLVAPLAASLLIWLARRRLAAA